MPVDLIATSLGSYAAKSLHAANGPVVRGVTSRGIYLQTSAHSVVFLTRDPTHGPFTINVKALPGEFSRLAAGDLVICQEERIDLPSEALTIRLGEAHIWTTPPPSPNTASATAQIQNLKTLARKLLDSKGWVGLASLLPDLIGLDGLPAAELDPLGMQPALLGCLEALTQKDAPAALENLLRGLGRGPGLTPSGDDLCVGVLLALNRGVPGWLGAQPVTWLAQSLREAAYQKTTTYSANLLEAAGEGQADERLLAACDSVFNGEPNPSTAAGALTHWGSSSGVDTLAGIALVCLASTHHHPSRPQESA
jgi:hypothetical protein